MQFPVQLLGTAQDHGDAGLGVKFAYQLQLLEAGFFVPGISLVKEEDQVWVIRRASERDFSSENRCFNGRLIRFPISWMRATVLMEAKSGKYCT